MSDRDELAALMRDRLRDVYMTATGLNYDAAFIMDGDPLNDAIVDGHVDFLDLADTILAAFDVTPKPVDTEPPPTETFNAITDWPDPVPGWETAGPTVYRVALALKRASEYDPHAVIHSPPTWFCADCQEFQPQSHEHWPHGLDNT